jgi:hypothetical protein
VDIDLVKGSKNKERKVGNEVGEGSGRSDVAEESNI